MSMQDRTDSRRPKFSGVRCGERLAEPRTRVFQWKFDIAGSRRIGGGSVVRDEGWRIDLQCSGFAQCSQQCVYLRSPQPEFRPQLTMSHGSN